MSTVHVVVGGQYGSEAKGHVAAWLCKTDERIKTAVRVAGPNAGHSAVDAAGAKWALRQIPVAAVVRDDLELVLGAGSEIDFHVLSAEIRGLEEGGHEIQSRLHIDRSATVLEPSHIEAEGGYGGELTKRLGSTGKGVGAARADRIWRTAQRWCDEAFNLARPDEDTVAWLRDTLDRGNDVLIEGTQGYALGLHGEHYPKCTSSDCCARDFLAMAGINGWDYTVTPWVVLRTFPIRVAGNSGDLFEETTWAELGEESGGYIKPEYTTVTKMERRVGRWDAGLARAACQANGPSSRVALSFFDYLYPEIAGQTEIGVLTNPMLETISQVEADCGAPIYLVGTGPNSIINLDPFINQPTSGEPT